MPIRSGFQRGENTKISSEKLSRPNNNTLEKIINRSSFFVRRHASPALRCGKSDNKSLMDQEPYLIKDDGVSPRQSRLARIIIAMLLLSA